MFVPSIPIPHRLVRWVKSPFQYGIDERFHRDSGLEWRAFRSDSTREDRWWKSLPASRHRTRGQLIGVR